VAVRNHTGCLEGSVFTSQNPRNYWLEEVLEAIALVRAIEAGEQTGTASRAEVFKIVEGG
jgi:hypothetical protein